MLRPVLSRFWFQLLLGFRPILAGKLCWAQQCQNCQLASYWLRPISPSELQTVKEPFTASSCNATAHFESLLVSAAPGFRPEFGWKLGCAQQCQNCQLASYWLRPISPCRAGGCFGTVFCGFLQCRGQFWVAPGFGWSWDFGRFWLVNCVNWQ